MVRRAEVWLVAAEKSAGGAKEDRWPGVVVSPQEMDEHLSTFIIAPMSTQDLPAPFRIPVIFMKNEGLILLDQICTLDKSRLIRKLGVVDDSTMIKTLDVLQEVFAY